MGYMEVGGYVSEYQWNFIHQWILQTTKKPIINESQMKKDYIEEIWMGFKKNLWKEVANLIIWIMTHPQVPC
jgi:hypothetical protein